MWQKRDKSPGEKGEVGRTEYSRQFWQSRGWNFARLEGHLGGCFCRICDSKQNVGFGEMAGLKLCRRPDESQWRTTRALAFRPYAPVKRPSSSLSSSLPMSLTARGGVLFFSPMKVLYELIKHNTDLPPSLLVAVL